MHSRLRCKISWYVSYVKNASHHICGMFLTQEASSLELNQDDYAISYVFNITQESKPSRFPINLDHQTSPSRKTIISRRNLRACPSSQTLKSGVKPSTSLIILLFIRVFSLCSRNCVKIQDYLLFLKLLYTRIIPKVHIKE